MKYSIVIPTYNHCDDLLKPCVESIFKYSDVSDIEIIISANGCVDNTKNFLDDLTKKYKLLGLYKNLKTIWNDKPLGYAKACNVAITEATTDYIVLLNNDTVLLEQYKNQWLDMLHRPFTHNPKCGISCVLKGPSEPAGHDFAIFFCVMIHRKVFDTIGLMSLDYGVGGGEDTEFSIECEKAGFEVVECLEKHFNDEISMFSGMFPIYHKGEGTVHDENLVPNWNQIFNENSLILAKKYNLDWYYKNLHLIDNKLNSYKTDLSFVKDQHEYIYNEVIESNVYELDFNDIKNYEFIDIGANIGSFSLLVGYFGAKQILAVEPIHKTYTMLCDNLNKIGLQNAITFKKAVGEIDGEKINLYSNTDSGLSSVYSASENYEVVETISLQTLMTYMKTDDVYLKCDCEGAEYDLLLNATDQDLHRIKYIAIEIHEDLHPKFKGSKILHDKFLKSGFHRIQEKRIFYWNFDQYGNKTNMRPSDIVVEIWKK